MLSEQENPPLLQLGSVHALIQGAMKGKRSLISYFNHDTVINTLLTSENTWRQSLELAE